MANNRQYCVYIADFDAVVVESLAVLMRMRDWQTRIFLSGQGLLEACEAKLPDCAIIDCDLPDMDVLKMLEWLHARDPKLPVILMSSCADIAMAVNAMKSGAKDFIEKPFRPQILFEKLGDALNNKTAPTGKQSQPEPAEPGADIGSLPARQRQILTRLVHGEHNKQIAFELGISERTVETHRARMMKRLGVHSLAELVKLAVQ